jgi:hypothetical protein
MPRVRQTVEQILAKLREAEVALSNGQSVAHVCRALSITEQPTIVGATSTAASSWIKSSGSKSWNGRTPAYSGPLPTSLLIN